MKKIVALMLCIITLLACPACKKDSDAGAASPSIPDFFHGGDKPSPQLPAEVQTPFPVDPAPTDPTAPDTPVVPIDPVPPEGDTPVVTPTPVDPVTPVEPDTPVSPVEPTPVTPPADGGESNTPSPSGKESKWGNLKSYLFPTLLFAFGIGGGMAIGGAMNRRGRK